VPNRLGMSTLSFHLPLLLLLLTSQYSNAVAIKNLLRLGQLLEEESLISRATESLISFHTILTKYPFAMPALVSSYMLYDKGLKQVRFRIIHHMILTHEVNHIRSLSFLVLAMILLFNSSRRLLTRRLYPTKFLFLLKKTGIWLR
jgi:uncharacterized protein YyaL (SSP411 family)